GRCQQIGQQRRVGGRACSEHGRQRIQPCAGCGLRMPWRERLVEGARGQLLRRIPAIEAARFVLEQARELRGRVIEVHPYRRRQATAQGRRRLRGYVFENKALFGGGQFQYTLVGRRRGVVRESQWHTRSVVRKQREINRNRYRLLVRLAGCRRSALREGQRVAFCGSIVVITRANFGRACLCVQREVRRQIHAIGFAQRGQQVVDGDGLSVEAREIQVGPLPETFGAQPAGEHPDQFGTFFVHGRGIEVVDRLVGSRAHRVRQRTGVFRKLHAAQDGHVFDALQRRRVHGFAEAVLAEHREAFLQGKLEPIPAGDAVAAPVVEVFVTDYRFDVAVFVVGGRFRVGEQIL